jgi:hypothetical protein
MNLPTVPAVRTARLFSDAHKRQYPRNTLAAGLVPSSVPPATSFDILVVLQCTPELTSALDKYIADIDGWDLWVPESHCFAQAVLHELRKYAPHIPACRAALHMRTWDASAQDSPTLPIVLRPSTNVTIKDLEQIVTAAADKQPVSPASCMDLLQLSGCLPHICALPRTEVDGGGKAATDFLAVITLVPRLDGQSYKFPTTAPALLVLLHYYTDSYMTPSFTPMTHASCHLRSSALASCAPHPPPL